MDLSIEDAYVALGITPGAPAEEVKAAWRRLASRWHPDRNPSAEAAALMQRINGAYERILRAAGDAPAPAQPASAGEAGTPPGRVLRRRVRLDLEEAALGTTRTLRGRVIDTCAPCEGRGSSATEADCLHCSGRGSVRASLWFGWLPASSPCPECEGRGRMPLPCAACAGAGRRRRHYERRVRFPAGLRDGDVLHAQVSGQADDALDATLELQLRLRPHPFFTTDAESPGLLRCEMPVDGFAWLAEAWAEVPTLEGPQQMRLRRNRLSYRLRGQGLPTDRGGAARGDLIVTVTPRFPDTLSPRRQALLEKLADAPRDAESDAVRAWRDTLADWQQARAAAAEA